jgi:hypothetical protein
MFLIVVIGVILVSHLQHRRNEKLWVLCKRESVLVGYLRILQPFAEDGINRFRERNNIAPAQSLVVLGAPFVTFYWKLS